MTKINLFITLLIFSLTGFSQTTINSESFEGGSFGIWNDGGTHCELINSVPPNGNYSVKLTGGASDTNHTVYSNQIDLSGYGSVDISFDFQTIGYSGSDDFYLEYNLGSSWIKFPTNGFNIDTSVLFINNTNYTQQKVSIDAFFTATTQFRFRSSASGDNPSAFLYIDNILIEAFAAVPPSPSVESIASGDVWRYFDDGTDLGTSWSGISYDDSAWEYGPSELGYGDGDEVTNIGQPATPRPYTTYFRKEFTIADKSIYNSIDLEAIRDDGLVVYLNGSEIWRDHMPSGTISFNTPANSPAIGGGDESSWLTKSIASSLLIDGTNVIAVEIHQQSTTSSDISFNFKLTPSAEAYNPVSRGPYLQSGTPTSVVVKWRTDYDTDSKVNYGTSLGSLNSSKTDAILTTEHEITLTGLSPNTKYYYDVGNSSTVFTGEESEMYVTTSPTHGTKQFVRAWALGDPGTEGNNTYPGEQVSVRDAYYNYVNNTNSPPVAASSNIGQTDMMLFLGDNAYNSGTETEYQKGLFDVYPTMLKKTVAWSTLGNHETYGPGTAAESPYYDIFTFPTAGEAGGNSSGTEAYYSFDFANIHFIVLESMSLYNDAGQIAWVTSDIQNTSQDWIIAFFHHPPYTKGSHNSDNAGESGGMTEMRTTFLPILEDNGVDLVLSGHSHSYERSFFINGHYGLSDTFDPNTHKVQTGDGKDDGDGKYLKTTSSNGGAVYVVTGSAGKTSGFNYDGFHEAMQVSKSQLGSSIIEIDNDGAGGQNLTLKFLRETGAIDDYFTINKSSSTLSTEIYEFDNKTIQLYPVPAQSFLNIVVKNDEIVKKIKFFNSIGSLVKESVEQQINVGNLKTGMYMVLIETNLNSYYKSIIIK